MVTLTMSNMEPQYGMAPVTADKDANVRFSLNITVTMSSKFPFKVTVSLDTRTSTGWSTSANPQSLQFRQSGTEEVNVTVIVPQGTLSDQQGTVTVNATATYPGFRTSGQSTATVGVEQYFLWTVAFAGVTPITTNDTIRLSIEICNKGNGQDQFEVGINDREEDTSPLGLHIAVDKSNTKTLAPDDKDTFTITVTYKGAKRPFGYLMTLRVISTAAKNSGNWNYGIAYAVPVLFNPSPPHNDTQRDSILKTAQQNYIPIVIVTIGIVVAVAAAIVIYRHRKKSKDLAQPQQLSK